MKERHLDARALDVFALARAAATVEGGWPLAGFERLGADLFDEADAPPAGEVTYRAAGTQRPVHGGDPETWLALHAEASVRLVCQRCLGPLAQQLQVDRRIRFVRDEQEAERLDEDSDDDVLALPGGRLDLHVLVEDELILALPLVPRHEACPQPLLREHDAAAASTTSAAAAAGPADGPGEPEEGEAGTRRPFAVLAQLRRGRA